MASASDLPARMPAKAPVYQPVPFTWTGFYIGANAGWDWTRTSGDATFAGAPVTFSGDQSGFLGGVQAGYNYQMGNIVFGLETDFQGSSNRGDVTFAGATPGIATLKNPWFGTVRGRLGYAADRWLLYVTGGGLYGENKLDGTLAAPVGAFSSSATYWTWTVGGGIERMLWGRWSAKVEYLYAGNPSSSPTPPGITNISTHSNTNIVRVGLNYHF